MFGNGLMALALLCAMSVPAGELTADKVPFFEWNHTYEQPTQEAGKESDIDGAGFNPWQYPSIHESL